MKWTSVVSVLPHLIFIQSSAVFNTSFLFTNRNCVKSDLPHIGLCTAQHFHRLDPLKPWSIHRPTEEWKWVHIGHIAALTQTKKTLTYKPAPWNNCHNIVRSKLILGVYVKRYSSYDWISKGKMTRELVHVICTYELWSWAGAGRLAG